MKWRIKKFPVLIILTLLLVLQLFLSLYHASGSTDYVIGNNFHCFFLKGSELAFQHGDQFLILTVHSGTFNTTNNCTLYIYYGGGVFTFKPLEDADFRLWYNVTSVKVNGTVYGSNSRFSVFQNVPMRIEWDVTSPPILPLMFILGIVGLTAMMGSPVYAIAMYRRREYRDALISGMIGFSLGFALFLSWLWVT